MADTVLAHIAGSIAQKENLATEALAFVLNRSPSARSALHRQIVGLVGEIPAIARVATQVAVGDESRPDLVLSAGDGRTIGYIEAKFWAALTGAQPVEYLRRLTGLAGGSLVMLAPERRLPTLRAEVMERCAAARVDLVPRGPWGFDALPNRIGILSWSMLLSTLRDAVADDHVSASDVQQLTGLCARFETEGFLPLTREDIDDLDVPRRVLALANLVNDITDAAVAAGVGKIKGLKATHYLHATGRYLALERAGCWFGLNHSLWSRWGRSPIWMRFDRGDWGRADLVRDAVKPWLSADPPRAFGDEDDGAVRIPLLLRTGAEKSAVVGGVVDQLRELNERLAAANLPPIQSVPPPAVG